MWYHYDRLGNVMDLTDENGNLTASYEQDAFGNVLSGSPSGYHLTTKEFSPLINLYYFYKRWYDSEIGIFTQKDFLHLKEETQNYVFNKGNPINLTDPSGELSFTSNNTVENPLSCAMSVGRQLAPWLRPKPESDKWKHCVAGCIIARVCGKEACMLAAFGKEIWDIISGGGQPELGDIQATLYGCNNASCKGDCGSLCEGADILNGM